MKATYLIGLLALAACGGESERYQLKFDPNGRPLERIDLFWQPGESDIGQSRKAFTYRPPAASLPGIRPGSELGCNTLDPQQNCVIPRYQHVHYVIFGGTTAQKAQVNQEVVEWYWEMLDLGLDEEALPFSETLDLGDPDLTLVVDIATGVSFCEGGSWQTRGLSCHTGSTTGVVDSGLKGTYHTWQEGSVPVLHIDYGDIMSRTGLTSTQKANLLHQAVWSGMLRFRGIGNTTVGDNRCNNAEVKDLVECNLRSQQACLINSAGGWDNTSHISLTGSSCGT